MMNNFELGFDKLHQNIFLNKYSMQTEKKIVNKN